LWVEKMFVRYFLLHGLQEDKIASGEKIDEKEK
jgi:hypothetical protein